MYEGWFGGWFGGWFSEWFGGTADVPATPTIGGGHTIADGARKKKAELAIQITCRQGQRTATCIIDLVQVLHVAQFQAGQASGAALDFNRSPVVLPAIARQRPGEIRLGRTIDTIGEYIPRPRPPVLHPSPKAPTRPQRQEARRPTKATRARAHDDEEAIVKAIASLL